MSNKRQDSLGEVVMYRTEDGQTALEVRLVGETVWLTQAQIAELFAVNVPAISKHITNIYGDKELMRKATVSEMETVRTEGKRKVTRRVEEPGTGPHSPHQPGARLVAVCGEESQGHVGVARC